jgi:hypothetical protein
MAQRIRPSSTPRRLWLTILILPVLMTGCYSLEYDLSSIAIPISAKPDPTKGGTRSEFRIETKAIHWVHGLFGTSNPDVVALVQDISKGYDSISDFRVSVGGGFHDWLITHLSGTLVRMKTVVIEGEMRKGGASPAPREPQS